MSVIGWLNHASSFAVRYVVFMDVFNTYANQHSPAVHHLTDTGFVFLVLFVFLHNLN